MSGDEITPLPALTLAQYTDRVTSPGEMAAVVGPLFGRLVQSLPHLGLDPDRPTIAWYSGAGPVIELGVGVPVTGGFDAGDTGLVQGHLPAVERALVVRHEGALEGLGQAWQDLHTHLTAKGLRPTGPSREVYLAGDVSRQDSWVIDLQQPVA